jgi:hypothetical protein
MAELVVTAALFAALPRGGAEAGGFDALVIILATVVVSTCLAWVAARRDIGARLVVANSASVPAVGLFVSAIRDGLHTSATWYGYLVVWAVTLAISCASSMAGYGIGRDPRWKQQPTKV